MNKLALFALAVATSLTSIAQIADVSSPEPLLRGVESRMYYPVLSVDGHKLMFSDADYSNLRIYDFDDNVTTKVQATPQQSSNASFSEKGQLLLDKKSKAKVTAEVEGSQLIITVGTKRTVCSPVECFAGYCWPSVSPDGKKVMFVAAGKGIVITDVEGNVLSRPGSKRLEAPVWYGNNHIVAMNTTDDCHQLSSSQIVMLTADGTAQQELTKPESMSMFPAASAQAGRIVYNTIDGRLYQLEVKLK